MSEGWHRAVVTEVMTLTEVRIRYIDYGTERNIDLSNCRFLHKKFTSLAEQVFIQPVKDAFPIKIYFHSFAIGISNQAFRSEAVRSDEQVVAKGDRVLLRLRQGRQQGRGLSGATRISSTPPRPSSPTAR